MTFIVRFIKIPFFLIVLIYNFGNSIIQCLFGDVLTSIKNTTLIYELLSFIKRIRMVLNLIKSDGKKNKKIDQI